MQCNSNECHLLFVFCVLMKCCQPFKNDVTEVLNVHFGNPVQDTPNNTSLNRAQNGARRLGSTEPIEQSQVGCRELRSTRYISDGQCTSLSPVKELVCGGGCLPARSLPNWIGGGREWGRRFWGRRDVPGWRCVNDRTRVQRVQLLCRDGSTRTYKVTAVTACRCKRTSQQHNESGQRPPQRLLPSTEPGRGQVWSGTRERQPLPTSQ